MPFYAMTLPFPYDAFATRQMPPFCVETPIVMHVPEYLLATPILLNLMVMVA